MMNEVPESVMRESDRAASILVVAGLLVGIAAPLIGAGRSRRR